MYKILLERNFCYDIEETKEHLCPSLAGYCFENNCYDPEKGTFIIINKEISDSYKIAVLFHEYSHYLCTKNVCDCEYDNVLAEKHALSTQLKACLYYKLDISLKLTMKVMKESLIEGDKIEEYPDSEFSKACSLVIKTDLWKNCKNFINKKKRETFSTSFLLPNNQIIKRSWKN